MMHRSALTKAHPYMYTVQSSIAHDTRGCLRRCFIQNDITFVVGLCHSDQLACAEFSKAGRQAQKLRPRKHTRKDTKDAQM